uniref:Uncharacterized protein n=1 Tax=Arundo donax TaxID=35708 RepID=A0A0A9GUY5_ARUDO
MICSAPLRPAPIRPLRRLLPMI